MVNEKQTIEELQSLAKNEPEKALVLVKKNHQGISVFYGCTRSGIGYPQNNKSKRV